MLTILAATACKSSPKPAKPQASNKIPHLLTKAAKKSIFAAASRDLDVALNYRSGDNTATLDNFVTGPAAKLIVETANNEAAQGKIKKRIYAERKFEVTDYFKTTAGVSLSFVDKGYYMDATSKQQITPPTNKKYKLIMRLGKRGKNWVLIELFQPQIQKDAPGGTPPEKKT